jgi:hypothetical protein
MRLVPRRVLTVAVLFASLWGAAGLIVSAAGETQRSAAPAAALCAAEHQDEGDGAWHAHRVIVPPASSWHAPGLDGLTMPRHRPCPPAAGAALPFATTGRLHVSTHLRHVPLLI